MRIAIDRRQARAMPADDSLSRAKTALVFLITLLVATAPLWFATYAPLNDYPFHIARIHILSQLQEPGPFHLWYINHTFLLPNVGMDLIALLLTKILPLAKAGQIFIFLMMTITLSGSIFLFRALHGRVTWWPFVSAFFLFNWIFLFGFLNYLIGVGVLLWGVGVWVALRERAVWWRLGAGTAFALALFFFHLVAFGLFAVIIAGYELQRAAATVRRSRRAALAELVIGASIFIPAIPLFLLSPTAENGSNKIHYNPEWIAWKGFTFYRAMMAGDWRVDIPLVLVGLLGLGLVLWRGRLVVARPMVLPLLFLLLTFIALPAVALGSFYLDSRTPIAILLVALASLDVRFADWRLRRAAIAGLALFMAVRSAVLADDWSRYDRVIGEFTQAFAQLPPGAVVFSATQGLLPHLGDLDLAAWQPSIKHVVSLAALYQPVFVPATYALPTSQPIRVTQPYREIYFFQMHDPIPVETPQELNSLVNRIRALAGPPTPVYCLILDPLQPFAPPPGTAVATAGSRFVLVSIGPAPG